VEQVQLFLEEIASIRYTDHSAKEPVMRKIIFAVAIALAVVGAGVSVSLFGSPELALAGCGSRC
jgi:hypothetical protein